VVFLNTQCPENSALWYNSNVLRKIRDFLELIKFEHTIFALPFAYVGMVLAAEGLPTWPQFFWITVAMAAARTLAMGTNRIADRVIDARNPRTANRPLVSGRIAPSTAWVGTVVAGVILSFAAWQLGPMPLKLLPGALLFLVGYAFTKRITWLSHFILGFTDGLAPVGAWVAVRGSLFTVGDLPAWLLLGVVTLWIGGFDLIYACQDVDFDREVGLHAIPARFGVAIALRLSTVCHALTLALLVALGAWLDFGWPYWTGMVVGTGLLVYEHALVRPSDLSRISVAFFNINSYISVVLFASVLGALYLI
jgi:4-hydroxybenzoate polyprenyltransferase